MSVPAEPTLMSMRDSDGRLAISNQEAVKTLIELRGLERSETSVNEARRTIRQWQKRGLVVMEELIKMAIEEPST